MGWVVGVYFQSSSFVFPGYIPRRGISRSYDTYIFGFWGMSKLFSIVATAIYILTNSEHWFPFFHILSNICYLCSFDDSHSDRYEVITCLHLLCISPIVMLSIFSSLLAFFRKISIWAFCLFFSLGNFFHCVVGAVYIYIGWIKFQKCATCQDWIKKKQTIWTHRSVIVKLNL